MNKLNNMNKKKLARKLRTRDEIKKKVSIFLTKAWEKRKDDIANRVNNRIKKVKARKEKRLLSED